MRLISKAAELETEFRRLIKKYKYYHWATAWASSGSKLFNDLVENKEKINKIVVGIHFYQTHPDFIEEFLGNKKVRFIEQPEGTFHPKLYLFSNGPYEWELIVGSANFTTPAFTKNTEASILISHKNSKTDNIYINSIKLVEQTFSSGKVFNQADLIKYQTIWKNHRKKIKSLSGQYGSKKSGSKPIHQSAMINRNWDGFMTKVRNEKSHGLERRLRVIEITQSLFGSVNHYKELTNDERKFIAGIPTELETDGAEDWGYFGSMKGAGIYANRIIENDINISKALDQIPLSGQITKKNFDDFIKYYSLTFEGNYLATATRLLAMKRPDTFVCFDDKNKSRLCKDFGIVQSGMDYQRYWDDIIERIYDSEWWQNPDPKDENEHMVNRARAAFLDSLYYEE